MFDFLKNAIKETKSSNGVVMHSDLVKFRNLIDIKGNIINKIFAESSIDSLFLPTFSYYGYDLKNKKVFNINDEAFLMGSLPNYAIRNKIGYRTLNPLTSYICIGEYSQKVFDVQNFKSFGKKSIFEYFCNENLLWCSLGCNEDHGFTIFYHPEYLARVPYRKEVKFKRKIFYNKKKFIMNYKYYSRKKNYKHIKIKRISDYLLEKKIIKLKIINNAKIYYGNCKSITSFLLKKLKKDKFFYIN